MLLASELVANSVLHAHDAHTVSIVVAISAAFVRIDVWDDGTTGIPHMRDTDDGTEGGRGLHLVNQLARRWGFERSPGRTCCWAEIVG